MGEEKTEKLSEVLHNIPHGPYQAHETPVDYVIKVHEDVIAVVPKWGRKAKAVVDFITAGPDLLQLLTLGSSAFEAGSRRSARRLLASIFEHHRRTQHRSLIPRCFYCFQSVAWKNPPPDGMKYPVMRHDGTWRDAGFFPLSEDSVEWVRKMRLEPCHYCGGAGGTVDHKVPECQGGAWSQENLVPACLFCNSLKADLDYEDFKAILAAGLRPILEQYGADAIDFVELRKARQPASGVP